MRSLQRFLTLAGIIIFLAMPASPVQAGRYVLDLAYEFEQIEPDTEITTLPVGLTYYADLWRFGIEGSWVSVDGLTSVIPNSQGGGINTLRTGTARSTRSGMGDTRLAIARAFFPRSDENLFYELAAEVKVPTASQSKLLGSGETDLMVSLFASYDFVRWTPGIELGYQWTGDRTDTDFNDILLLTLGATYHFDPLSKITLVWDFRDAIVEGADNYSSAGVTYKTRLFDSLGLGFGLQAGLSDSAPDLGLSVSLSTRF